MNRLRYSTQGYLRSLQVSRAKVNVYVEGRQLDGYVYGRIVARECRRPFEYRLRRADELPGSGGGGKKELLQFHDRLRRRGELTGTLHGSSYATLFFLDKDVDDLLRRKKRSKHVIYTSSYDLEGEVFMNGDLVEAVAAACSLDPARVASTLTDPAAWRSAVMTVSREWVTLCVLSQKTKSRGVCNFGVTSKVNDPLDAPADSAKVLAYEAQIEKAAPLDKAAFAAHHATVLRSVAARYRDGRAHEVFKGKWFAEYIDLEVSKYFTAERARVGGFRDRVVGHLAQSVDVDDSWAERYRSVVRHWLAA